MQRTEALGIFPDLNLAICACPLHHKPSDGVSVAVVVPDPIIVIHLGPGGDRGLGSLGVLDGLGSLGDQGRLRSVGNIGLVDRLRDVNRLGHFDSLSGLAGVGVVVCSDEGLMSMPSPSGLLVPGVFLPSILGA